MLEFKELNHFIKLEDWEHSATNIHTGDAMFGSTSRN